MKVDVDTEPRNGHGPIALSWDISTPLRVMVVGIGQLGSRVLEGLMHLGGAVEVIAAGPKVSSVERRANAAMFAAMHTVDKVPTITSAEVDLFALDRTAETLARLSPDVVVHCATLYPYSTIAALPPLMRTRLAGIGLGPWLPTQLVLAERLMKAIKSANTPTYVVNCAYPDAVNPALATLGHAPLLGAGNLANNEPALRHALAALTATKPNDVDLHMVMHHYVSHRIHRVGDAGGAPFYLSYDVGLGHAECRATVQRAFRLLSTKYRRAPSTDTHIVPAAATVAVVSALAGTEERRLHAPGPFGHAGGYPVRVSQREVEIMLPLKISMLRACEINAAAQRFDGIDAITADGDVHFTDESVEIFTELLGHYCATFNVASAEDWANELLMRCDEHAHS